MKKAILAFVMVAVVAAAQPAGAIDKGFRGPYRVILRESASHSCPTDTAWYRVRIRYVSERVRRYDRFAPGSGRPLRYVGGVRLPWHGGPRVKLRYHGRTDSAVGVQHGLQGCSWRLRLVSIGGDRPNPLVCGAKSDEKVGAVVGKPKAIPLHDLDGVDDAIAAAASFEEFFELERDRLFSLRIVSSGFSA